MSVWSTASLCTLNSSPRDKYLPVPKLVWSQWLWSEVCLLWMNQNVQWSQAPGEERQTAGSHLQQRREIQDQTWDAKSLCGWKWERGDWEVSPVHHTDRHLRSLHSMWRACGVAFCSILFELLRKCDSDSVASHLWSCPAYLHAGAGWGGFFVQ